MKTSTMLTIASLLSVILTTFHLADDIARGMEKGTISNLVALPILVVWLYAALVLAGKRSGYVIIFLASLLGLLVPVIHMKGAGVGATVAKGGGALFFVWTLLALGLTSLFSIVLSLRGLWEQMPWRAAPQHKQGAVA